MSQRYKRSLYQRRQSGVVLVVGMVMLLLITIMGMTSIKSLTLEQRMTSNSVDRNIVFQVTEWALSVAEQAAETQAKLCNSGFVNQGVPVGSSTPTGSCVQTACQNGYCGYPQPNCPHRWEDSTFNGWAYVKDPEEPTQNLVTPLGVTPQFIIEFLNNKAPNCIGTSSGFSYRITVKTEPGDGRAAVTLQSIYSD